MPDLAQLGVFEHLSYAMEVGAMFRRALAPDGSIVTSTEPTAPAVTGRTGPTSRADGQHGTFWSQEARAHFAAELGLSAVASFPGDEGFLTLTSPFQPAELGPALKQAQALLHDPNFVSQVAQRWDSRSDGVVAEVSEPIVRPAAPVSRR